MKKNNFISNIIPTKKEEESKKFKLIITQNIEKQIRRLCNKFPGQEWSGPLFFKIKEGSIENVESLIIEAIDLFPADLGNGTYTEYDNMDRINMNLYSHQEYMDDKDLLDAMTGHIHSHNTMATFFSGTDLTELESHAKNHNFYLSLIVNNKLDCTAKICEPIDIISVKKVVRKFGSPKVIETKSEGVITYDAIIEYEDQPKVDDALFEKAMEALDQYVEAKKPKYTSTHNYASGNFMYNPQETYAHFNARNFNDDIIDDYSSQNQNITTERTTSFTSIMAEEDITISLLSGWTIDEFDFETTPLMDFEDFIDFIKKTENNTIEFSKTFKGYIKKNLGKIVKVYSDYKIKVTNENDVIKTVKEYVESQLAPWNYDLYTRSQIKTINELVIILNSLM